MTEEEKELYEERIAICLIDGNTSLFFAKQEAKKQVLAWRKKNDNNSHGTLQLKEQPTNL